MAGEVWIDGKRHEVEEDMGVIVPQGARHNVICTGNKPLRLYTICARRSIAKERSNPLRKMRASPLSILTA